MSRSDVVVAVAAQFATRFPPVAAEPVLRGHIHETYVVTCRPPAATAGAAGADAAVRIVLQRLNGEVFHDLDALTANLRRVTAHLRQGAAERGVRPIVADPIETHAGGWTYVDEGGATWRASGFVEGARVLGADATTDDLRVAARAFAELTRDLDDLGPPPLAETIPRFHDLARRRAALATAIAADRAGRSERVVDLTDRANLLGDRLDHELDIAGAYRLPNRIVHNDAKLDNVLVDSATGALACIVDLDTVMPGSVLYDFGELARTATSRAPEDEPDPTLIELDRERFAALADGYITGARSFLLDSERACLALAGPLMTLENAVRFLSDHLDGDIYFRLHRPDHNAQRCRAQLRLAEQMLDRLDELRDAIAAAGSPSRSAP
jgi:Phosphotransferase enzyme family